MLIPSLPEIMSNIQKCNYGSNHLSLLAYLSWPFTEIEGVLRHGTSRPDKGGEVLRNQKPAVQNEAGFEKYGTWGGNLRRDASGSGPLRNPM